MNPSDRPVLPTMVIFNVALVALIVATGGFMAFDAATIALPTEFATAPGVDFNAFYGASTQVNERDFDTLYDFERFRASAPAVQALAWLYPPTMLLLIEPLAALPYPVAKLGWMLATIAAFVLACVRLGLRSGGAVALVLTSAPVLFTLAIVQASAFFLLPLVVAMTEAHRRPVTAGLCAALLTVKPQYGVVLPIFLLAIGARRAFAVAACGTIAFVALSLMRYGVPAWQAYLTDGMAWGRDLATGGYNYFSMTLYQPLAIWGAGGVSDAVQGAIVAFTWVCVAATARFASPRLALGVALLGTAASAPYFNVYDGAVAVLGLLVVAGCAEAGRVPRAALLTLYAFPALCWVSATALVLRGAHPFLLVLGNLCTLYVLSLLSGPSLRHGWCLFARTWPSRSSALTPS